MTIIVLEDFDSGEEISRWGPASFPFTPARGHVIVVLGKVYGVMSVARRHPVLRAVAEKLSNPFVARITELT